MNLPQLKLFTDPNLLGQTDRVFLTRLLEHLKDSLPPAAAHLLAADLDHEQFCAAWAAPPGNPSKVAWITLVSTLETAQSPGKYGLVNVATPANPNT